MVLFILFHVNVHPSLISGDRDEDQARGQLRHAQRDGGPDAAPGGQSTLLYWTII